MCYMCSSTMNVWLKFSPTELPCVLYTCIYMHHNYVLFAGLLFGFRENAPTISFIGVGIFLLIFNGLMPSDLADVLDFLAGGSFEFLALFLGQVSLSAEVHVHVSSTREVPSQSDASIK